MNAMCTSQHEQLTGHMSHNCGLSKANNSETVAAIEASPDVVCFVETPPSNRFPPDYADSINKQQRVQDSETLHHKSFTTPTTKSCSTAQGEEIEGGFTTAMIRNIPFHYKQHHLIQELVDLGFESTCYNFLYMPRKSKRANVGYAFVNFEEAHWVGFLKQAMHRHRFTDMQGRPSSIPNVSLAACQGLQNNLGRANKRARKRKVLLTL